MNVGNLVNIKTSISEAGNIEYRLEVYGDSIERSGNLSIFQLGSLPKRNFAFLYSRLKPTGLNDEDVVTQIVNFYPNGVIADFFPEYRRRGFGTFLLERMLEDSRFGKAKAIFTRTTAEPMKQFLLKKEFTEVNEISYINSKDYYKIL